VATRFAGPSGTGKTPLPRIIARQLQCPLPLEIHAASKNSVEHTRELKDCRQYRGLVAGLKVIILDECPPAQPTGFGRVVEAARTLPHGRINNLTRNLGSERQ